MLSGSQVYARTDNLSYRKPLKCQKVIKAWSREIEKRKFRCKKVEEEMLGLENWVWKRKRRIKSTKKEIWKKIL